MSLPARAATPASVDRQPPISWPAVVAVFAALFVIRFSTFYLDDITRAVPGTFATRIIEELTGAGTALLLFPGVLWAERRWPMSSGRWRRHWGFHLVALCVYSVCHTSLMAVSRWTIFPAVGLGPYDYGRLGVRYFMEFGNDIIGYTIFIAVLTLFRVRARLHDEELRVAALARDGAEARLEALGLRLQPHFLFNALNTISSILYEDPAAADAMIGHLGDLLRHALRTAEHREISVAEEVETLDAYLAIVDARFGDRVSCELTVAPEARALSLPPFLLQPLVENAVRHGSAKDGAESSVVVGITVEQSMLQLVVENDVAPTGEPGAGGGTGLRTTANRLRLLYGDAHHFSASRDGGRFRVIVRLGARIAEPTHPRQHEPAHASADR